MKKKQVDKCHKSYPFPKRTELSTQRRQSTGNSRWSHKTWAIINLKDKHGNIRYSEITQWGNFQNTNWSFHKFQKLRFVGSLAVPMLKHCNLPPKRFNLIILWISWGLKQTSCFGPNVIYWGESTATKAGSQSFIAACRSFKCPHLGCLSNPVCQNTAKEVKWVNHHLN